MKLLIKLPINHVVCIFEGHLDDETLHFMSMPRCGVRDKVGFATDSRSRRYALQGKYNIEITIYGKILYTSIIYCMYRHFVDTQYTLKFKIHYINDFIKLINFNYTQNYTLFSVKFYKVLNHDLYDNQLYCLYEKN